MLAADVRHRFAFHPATTAEKKHEHEGVRDACLFLALYLNDRIPEGREKSLAITKLEEVMMWSNAAIAMEQV